MAYEVSPEEKKDMQSFIDSVLRFPHAYTKEQREWVLDIINTEIEENYIYDIDYERLQNEEGYIPILVNKETGEPATEDPLYMQMMHIKRGFHPLNAFGAGMLEGTGTVPYIEGAETVLTRVNNPDSPPVRSITEMNQFAEAQRPGWYNTGEVLTDTTKDVLLSSWLGPQANLLYEAGGGAIEGYLDGQTVDAAMTGTVNSLANSTADTVVNSFTNQILKNAGVPYADEMTYMFDNLYGLGKKYFAPLEGEELTAHTQNIMQNGSAGLNLQEQMLYDSAQSGSFQKALQGRPIPAEMQTGLTLEQTLATNWANKQLEKRKKQEMQVSETLEDPNKPVYLTQQSVYTDLPTDGGIDIGKMIAEEERKARRNRRNGK